jgi:integrase
MINAAAKPRTARLSLTRAAIDKLDAPLSGRKYIYDTKTPGLALCITDTSSRSWYVYRRVNGRPERISLGRWPQLDVDKARRLASEINGEIARGVNRAELRRIARAEMTFGQLFDRYMVEHAKMHKKPRSWREDQGNFDRHLSHWRDRRHSTIESSDVASLHLAIGKNSGQYAANRVLSLISKMSGFAAQIGYAMVNPAKGVKRFPEQARERFLQTDEMRPFFMALKAEPNESLREFILMALFTGARRRNVQAMRWEHVHIDRATWELPGTETKNGKPLAIALPPPAIAILRRRLESLESTDWVFPGAERAGILKNRRDAGSACLIALASRISEFTICDVRLDHGRPRREPACRSLARRWAISIRTPRLFMRG